MTNVLPQASNMNRGAWLRTEEIAECYRDLEPVTVIGGVIWGDNPRTDFVASHGVATPDAFWKVLIRVDRAIAWVIPNTAEATRQRLDDYLVSIADPEARAGKRLAPAVTRIRLAADRGVLFAQTSVKLGSGHYVKGE